MLEIIVRGGPRSGKSMVATMLYSILEMVGARVRVEDDQPFKATTLQGVGGLIRKMFGEGAGILIRTESTPRVRKEAQGG